MYYNIVFFLSICILFFNVIAIFFFVKHMMRKYTIVINTDGKNNDKKQARENTNTNNKSEVKQTEKIQTKEKKSNENEKEDDNKEQDHLDYTHPIPYNMFPWNRDNIYKRDRAVINDPLYPPLNRNSIDFHDTYRHIGYLVNEETKDDSWKLFARSKNKNQAQFYASSIDNNIDLKINLTDDMIRGNKLRDLYNLPDHIIVDHPLFSSNLYTIVENPQTDFSSFYF